MGGLEALLPLVLIFVVFYFLLIRPQQKKMKQHKEMLNNIRRGDRIVTGGGIMGEVTKVNDGELTVEIAENVKVKVQRELVSTVVSKTEPASGDKGGKGSQSGAANDEGGSSGGGGGMLKNLLGGGKKD